MCGWLALLFIVLPVAEIWAFVQLSAAYGFFFTLWASLLLSVLGLRLLRRDTTQGLGTMPQMLRHRFGGDLEGALLSLAGGLLLVPGFFTDALGLLLIPRPVRAMVVRLLPSAAGAQPARPQTMGGYTVHPASGLIDLHHWRSHAEPVEAPPEADAPPEAERTPHRGEGPP